MAKYFLMMQAGLMAANRGKIEAESPETSEVVLKMDEESEISKVEDSTFSIKTQEFNSTGSFSKSTEKCVKFAVSLLKVWCETNGEITNIESMTPCELNDILAKFYERVRTKTGELYSVSSLTSFRYSLNRYFQSFSIDKRFNIIEDQAFVKSNEVFSNVMKCMKRGAAEKKKEKQYLTTEDIRKIYTQVFAIDSPKTLQFKVWLEVATYFTKCGRQKQRYLNKNSFVFGTDSLGKFVTLKRNHDAYHNVKKMYEKKNHPLCPVRSLAKYLSKLNPDGDDLFQRPKYKISLSNSKSTWYYSQPVGKNYLGNVMSLISRQAGIAKNISNKCLKKITPEVLENVVFTVPYPQLELLANTAAYYATRDLQNGVPLKHSDVVSSSNSQMDSSDNINQEHDMDSEYELETASYNRAKQEVLKVFQKLTPQTLANIVRWLKNVDITKDLTGELVCEDNSQFVTPTQGHYNEAMYQHQPQRIQPHPPTYTYTQGMTVPTINYTLPSRYPLTPLPIKPMPMSQYTTLSSSRQQICNNTALILSGMLGAINIFVMLCLTFNRRLSGDRVGAWNKTRIVDDSTQI